MSGSKSSRLAMLIFDTRRSLSFSAGEEWAKELAGGGYYFDKISKVAFDSQDEIVRSIGDGVNNYENVLILCPAQMEETLKSYISGLCGCQFDSVGIMRSQNVNAFMAFTDGVNRITSKDIISVLNSEYGESFARSYIRFVGAPYNLINEVMGQAKKLCDENNSRDILFNVAESYGDFRMEIVYSDVTPKMLVDRIIALVVGKLGDYVYALEDITLAAQLIRLLKLRRMKIGIAESFTGGGVGKRIVDIPGASEVYYEGLNTYSNTAKMLRLGVKEMTLKQCGAVSAEVAYQMAEGVLSTGNCDVSVSTTGIAGPASDNTSKPVGLAFIGVGVDGDIAVYKFNFTGDRKKVTETAINQALFLTYKRLK